MDENLLKKIYSEIMNKNIYDIIFDEDSHCRSTFELPISNQNYKVVINCFNKEFNWLSIEEVKGGGTLYLESSGKNTKRLKVCALPLIEHIKAIIDQFENSCGCDCLHN